MPTIEFATMHRINCALSFVVCFLLSQPANAALIQLNFTGTVVDGTGTIAVGTAFSGFAMYNSAQANPGDPNTQNYTYQGGQLDFPGASYSFPAATCSVDNNGSFAGDRIVFNAGPIVMGGTALNFGRLLELIDTTNQAISSADLPFNTNVVSYNFARFLFFADTDDFQGRLLTLSAVPEPSCLALGVMAWSTWRLQRNKKRRLAAC